jgi:hypothetical protein
MLSWSVIIDTFMDYEERDERICGAMERRKSVMPYEASYMYPWCIIVHGLATILYTHQNFT